MPLEDREFVSQKRRPVESAMLGCDGGPSERQGMACTFDAMARFASLQPCGFPKHFQGLTF